MSRKQIAVLLLITIGALLVHGYHPAVEDGELYLPGIKRDLNPALYRFNSQFFMSHAHATLFDELVARSVRISHLPLDYVIFFWHFACLFLFLLGCWRVARLCFDDNRAAWGGVALVAALLTIPVAGTALYITDQYFTPRDLSTAGIMFVLLEALQGRVLRTAIGIFLLACLHPLMAVFGGAFLFFLFVERRRSSKLVFNREPEMVKAMLALAWLPLLPSPSSIYRRLLETNDSYFLVTRWLWVEWLGIVIPLLLLWWIARYGTQHGLEKVTTLSRAAIAFTLVFLAAALLVCLPRMTAFALLQPMRCLHLVFIMLFLLLGGVLAQSWMKASAWRWIVLFAPLCLLMFFVQRQLFPASEHLELPGRRLSNPWVQAFEWSRTHTPPDAIFALHPNYMNLPGEDEHGFRALAERSSLAGVRDNGSVSMFPSLAEEWARQVGAHRGWQDFQRPDFERLRRDYGVTWFVLHRGTEPGIACPYQNAVVMVCYLN